MSDNDRDLFSDPEKEDSERLRRTVSFALSSIKSSIERGFPPRALEVDDELSRVWKRSVLKVEAVRVDFSSFMLRPFTTERLRAVFGVVHDDLVTLLDDPEFMALVSQLRYRPLSTVQRDQDQIDSRILDRGEVIPNIIATVVELTRGGLREGRREVADIAALRQIVPPQKIAPVQFEIKNSRLIIVDQPADALTEDLDNIAASRDALIRRGEQILESLEQSNCDRRLVESVRELQVGLESNQNIIQLGLNNITCEAVFGAFQNELPDALFGKLQGHARGVSMYLAQFPEWQKFSEKAATVDLDADDIRRISATAQKLATELEARPEIASPEVPRTIIALSEAIKNPGLATKRAAFAVLRSVENLVAKAIEHGAELIDGTISKSIADLSTVAAKTIVIGLLSIALSGATGLAPIAGKVSEAAWLKNVVEVIENQLSTSCEKMRDK